MRRRFDVLVWWRLDRLGRNLRHLILLLDELHAVGVAFVSLAEGIDATTPAGRLQLHVLGAIAEFERARIQECIMAGLARAKAQGKRLGRPRLRIAGEPLEHPSLHDVVGAEIAALREDTPQSTYGFMARSAPTKAYARRGSFGWSGRR